MGQSTNAYLFYGITSSQEEEDPVELATKLCDAFGIEFEMAKNEDGEEEDPDLYNCVIDNEKLGEALLVLNLGIATHCSCDYPIPFIYVGDYKKAYRGDAVVVDCPLPNYQGTAEYNDLCNIADKLGWKKPNWYLVSDWC